MSSFIILDSEDDKVSWWNPFDFHYQFWRSCVWESKEFYNKPIASNYIGEHVEATFMGGEL